MTIDLDNEKFNRIFLKNLFIEILKEKEYPGNVLAKMCEILAEIYISEFGANKSPSSIISQYGSIENWLMKKVESLAS